MQEVHDYGINFWSNNEFKIEKGLVKVCHGKKPLAFRNRSKRAR